MPTPSPHHRRFRSLTGCLGGGESVVSHLGCNDARGRMPWAVSGGSSYPRRHDGGRRPTRAHDWVFLPQDVVGEMTRPGAGSPARLLASADVAVPERVCQVEAASLRDGSATVALGGSRV